VTFKRVRVPTLRGIVGVLGTARKRKGRHSTAALPPWLGSLGCPVRKLALETDALEIAGALLEVPLRIMDSRL